MSLSDLEREARALPPEERARLVEALLESLQAGPLSEIEAAWSEEVRARLAAFDRGDARVFAAESVFAEARRITN